MRKIKIAFFADILLEDLDGCTRTIHQIIKRIPRDRFEILFITGVKPDRTGNNHFFEVPTITIPLNATYKIALPFLSLIDLRKQLNDFKPDIIHISNPSLLGKYGINYAKKSRLPIISIYHTHFLTYVKYYLKRFPSVIPMMEGRVVAMTKKIYDHCDLVYFPVANLIEEFDRLGFKTNHCKVWSRGINTELFNPNKRDKNYFHKYGINKGLNLLFVSRLVWEKNLQTLVDIYNTAKQMGSEYNFILAGTGVAEEELKKRMPEALFLGHVDHDELANVYASSDVFLFPSDTESYGNVVIEAMASGLPPIAADSGGPSGIIDDGVTGYLCPPHTAKAYLQKIHLLANDPILYKSISHAARAYTNALSWDALVEEYFTDIDRLANREKQKYA